MKEEFKKGLMVCNCKVVENRIREKEYSFIKDQRGERLQIIDSKVDKTCIHILPQTHSRIDLDAILVCHHQRCCQKC